MVARSTFFPVARLRQTPWSLVARWAGLRAALKTSGRRLL
jgi:hypothetical protein